MFEIQGKYNVAKVFTDVVDEASVSQVITLCNQEFTQGQTIRMMPDIHAGAGCTIGTTMTIQDKIVPNLVGVDIGCGMYTVMLKETSIDFRLLDDVIRTCIPSGMNVRTTPHKFVANVDTNKLRCAKSVDVARAALSVGTLGGGNHFLEVDVDDNGHLYLVIHSGSRHLGKQVAEHYQRIAYEKLNSCDKKEIQLLVAKLKEEGKASQIETEIAKLKNTKKTSIPKDLAYVVGSDFDDYLHDMAIVQKFADINRKAMADTIIKKMGLHVMDSFTTIHNYIDVENMILRKGSVSAQKGEKLLIPINMRDGSLVCVGRGNKDWNYSAPHGAGRLMSRHQAKESLSLDVFEEQMKGIYSTSVNLSTIDESPMAYKDMSAIIDNIGPTADIVSVIKPLYNFKAGDN